VSDVLVRVEKWRKSTAASAGDAPTELDAYRETSITLPAPTFRRPKLTVSHFTLPLFRFPVPS